MKIEEIEDLSIKTYNILKRAGINDVSQIMSMTESEIMQIKGITRWSIDELTDRLNHYFK